MPYRRLAAAAGVDKWRTVAFILGAFLLGTVVLVVVNRINNNSLAIEKGCILLNNVVIRSGAAGQSTGPRADINRLLTSEIVDKMTPAERDRYFRLRQEVAKQAREEPLVIDCQRVADDPDSIRAIQLQTP